MSALEQESKKRGLKTGIKVILAATAFAVVATASNWLLLSPASPMHHRFDPNQNPLHAVWSVVHAPALIFWTSISSPKWHSETALFVCIYMQWFVVGAGVGL
jgi:hypothetical protein